MMPLYFEDGLDMSKFQSLTHLQRILGRHPLAIIAGEYRLNPGRVFQVPLDGFTNSGFKSFLWTPAQFRFDFTDVHGISAVMPRAIGDIGDQLVRGMAESCGCNSSSTEQMVFTTSRFL